MKRYVQSSLGSGRGGDAKGGIYAFGHKSTLDIPGSPYFSVQFASSIVTYDSNNNNIELSLNVNLHCKFKSEDGWHNYDAHFWKMDELEFLEFMSYVISTDESELVELMIANCASYDVTPIREFFLR